MKLAIAALLLLAPAFAQRWYSSDSAEAGRARTEARLIWALAPVRIPELGQPKFSFRGF